MMKFKKTLKWLLIIALPLSSLYGILWLKITKEFCSAINTGYADQPIEIAKGYNIKFKKASINLNPFTISLNLHELIENSNINLIKHSEPITIGYNIISQKLYSHYKGESIANYYPINSGFGSKVTGEYTNSIKLPLNFKLVKILKGDGLFELINFLNNLEVDFRDVVVRDLVDDKVVVGDAGLNLKLSIDNNIYYKNLEEFMASPPKDFLMDINTHISDVGPLKLNMPVSIIYGYYPTYQFKYSLKAKIHNEARNILSSDIIKKLSIKIDDMEYSSDLQNSSSNMQLETNIKDKDLECSINYNTKLKLSHGFSSALETTLRLIARLLPSISETQDAKRVLSTLDISSLDLQTENEPISISLSSNFAEKDQEFLLKINNLELSYQNTSFALNCDFSNDEKGKSYSSGVFAITNYEKVIDYLTYAYLTMQQYSNSGNFDYNFYKKTNRVFAQKIANSFDEKDSSIAIKYDISREVEKSQIGKFTLQEAILIYYSTIFSQTKQIFKDPDEALSRFKTIAPENILEQQTLDKIVAAQ